MPGFAPKIRELTSSESQASFDTWRETLLFHLTLDGSFEDFLDEDAEWGPGSVENRGLTPDDPKKTEKPRSAKQKAAFLKLMLGTIASYVPVISRHFIVNEALCLQHIWHKLRIHYGFRKTGALILDLPSFSQEEGESCEGLWERLYAYISDNLLQPSDGLMHEGEGVTTKEVISPTLLNATVALWLKTIHPALPAMVKQKYATELRNKTLASIREEISESLEPMLAEIRGETASLARASFHKGPQKSYGSSKQYSGKKYVKVCPLCEASKRPADHYLSQCPYLPESDKKFFSKRTRLRVVEVTDDDESDTDECTEDVKKVGIKRTSVGNSDHDMLVEIAEVLSKAKKGSASSKSGPKTRDRQSLTPNVNRVDVVKSPVLFVNYGEHVVDLTIDTGAEADCMKHSYAQKLHIPILPTSTLASQADGVSHLNVVGEVHIKFTWRGKVFSFDGLVVTKLADNVIAGSPFQAMNDVYARPSKKIIYVQDEVVKYGAQAMSSRAKLLRIPRNTTILPGSSISLQVPKALQGEGEVAVEPHCCAQSRQETFGLEWLKPSIVKVEEGKVTLVNESEDPVIVRRHEQVAMARPVVTVDNLEVLPETPSSRATQAEPVMAESQDYHNVNLDPDKMLSQAQRDQFIKLHKKYREVFDSRTLGLYNGKSGPLEVKINMGPTQPPQRKGRMPAYSRQMLEELQRECDKLEGSVLLKPEDVGIVAEYLNNSFLVKKPNGEKRFVTNFAEVAHYAKPQSALMQDCDSALRHIGNWRYIVGSDMSKAYWQMRTSLDSMKYLGVATPFKGVRVYGRGAMGMPGTETALEELLCRVLEKPLADGGCVRVADDLYCGGDTPEEALYQWQRVLEAMASNGLRLSAPKTVVCPRSMVILGWLWECGTIRASPHRVSALCAVDPLSLTTVGKVRSFVGSVKFNNRVIKLCSDTLQPLEELIAGRNKTEKVLWTEQLLSDFKQIQDSVKAAETITLPKREDQLQIVTDASSIGVGAALYVVRKGEPLLAGHFNARLKKHQLGWLPCEIEALSINAAVNHFAPEIINSQHQAVVLSDSLPCIQAAKRLQRGQFSTSPRVSTFLATLSRYNVHLMHLKGSENVYSDFISRNPVDCKVENCQVCSFIAESSDSVVRSCSVQDVLESTSTVPFSSRSGWHELQLSDESLRRTCAHLRQGTRPSQKITNLRDVKRYLQSAKVARDGLVIVESHSPVAGRSERIVVPREYLHGLLECLHLKLQHPTKSQLRKVFLRAYYALDLEQALEIISKNCHTCVSLQDMPNKFLSQSMTTVPTAVGSNFSADVVQRGGQSVLAIREYVSSFTLAKIILNEKASTLRDALMILGSELIPPSGPRSTIKVDPASGCRSLMGDKELLRSGIQVELGHAKFKNKNPVAERAIRELHSELNRTSDGGQITERSLAKAVASMNGRLRGEGLSAWEMWTHRCQYTGSQLPVDDLLLIRAQEKRKLQSHGPSSVFKARGKTFTGVPDIKRGDLVFINSDRSKLKKRERYVVIDVYRSTCKLQKFVGSQLRARPYIVNRADIIVIQPWVFPEVPDTDDDEGEKVVRSDSNVQDDIPVDAPGEGVAELSEEDDVIVAAAEKEQPPRSRSGRPLRKPSHLADYVE